MKKLLVLLMLMVAGFATVLEVPAVTSDGKGIKVNLECEVVPGNGKILVATEPLVGITTQQSERNAVRAVEKYLGMSLSGKDVIFVFRANTTSSVEGGSAGVAMAVCLISELTNRTPSEDVSVTGAIDEEGNVKKVGGILQKANAMKDKSVFLIPKGQEITHTYLKRFHSPYDGIYVEELYPVSVNVSEFAKENWNTSVVEIATLQDAISWFFDREIPHKQVYRPAALPEFERKLERINKLAEYEVERAEKTLRENDTASQKLMDRALDVPEGYPYTRANYAFLVAVSAGEGNDVTTIARKLAEEFKKTPTSDPYWRAEAEERLSWALYSTENPAARKEWLLIAAKMFSLERFGNESIDASYVKKQANSRIIQAKDEVERAKMAGADVSLAENSLNLAIKSYENELYFAALYNAMDAIAWARANLGGRANITEELTHEFPEAYRRHAIYLFYNAENPSDRNAALYSAIRADLREGAFEEADHLPFSLKLPSISLKDLILVTLAGYLLWEEINKKKPAGLNQKDEMILLEVKSEAVKALQRKLEKGEIKRDEYERIMKKLEGL